LRVDASILGRYSASRTLADEVQKHWNDQHPDAAVIYRDLAASPVLASSWIAAVSGNQIPDGQRTADQKAGLALAQELFEELTNAQSVLLATGLYNWGVNQLVKSWIDQILVVAAPLGEVLRGKDIVIVVSRGGYYGEDGPKAGWDHGTPWLVRIFSDQFGGDVTLVERDFTLVGVNPALNGFKEQGAALKKAALADAEKAGKALAAAYSGRIARLTAPQFPG
ncbi:FMN-dependent NADH-azoreductase, partial [Nocardia farcinica]|uniref:FMN-dependent NADH-azoreductase n=1 Tax=Nocardia farcinica TaxID=37329 RepID=UPI0022B9FA80